MAISVKLLVWSAADPDHPVYWESARGTQWAAGFGGHYRAEPNGMLWMAHDEFEWMSFDSLEAAKQAAQDDHDKRVRSLIIEEGP